MIGVRELSSSEMQEIEGGLWWIAIALLVSGCIAHTGLPPVKNPSQKPAYGTQVNK